MSIPKPLTTIEALIQSRGPRSVTEMRILQNCIADLRRIVKGMVSAEANAATEAVVLIMEGQAKTLKEEITALKEENAELIETQALLVSKVDLYSETAEANTTLRGQLAVAKRELGTARSQVTRLKKKVAKDE